MTNINVTASNMSKLTQNAFMECLFKEGEVSYCMPREVWQILPGRVPYVIVK